MLVSFGSGVLIGTENDVTGQTPFNFGKIQECQMDLSFTTKMLYGQYQYPLDIARGQGKVTCKAKAASISGYAFGSFFLGQTPVAGVTAMQFSESHTAASSITIAPPSSGTFVDDQGVVNGVTGLPLVLVTTAPAIGSYEVNVSTGAYTFNASQPGPLLISYRYSLSATGQHFTLTNQLLGTTPTFSAVFRTIKNNLAINVKLNYCVSSKYQFQTKLEDYTIPEFDFDCFADASNNILTWAYDEVS